MPALASDLRRQLETVIIQARDVVEDAARSALQKRAVDVAEPFSHFGAKEKELRNRLRARGRQVGDVRNADKTQDIDQLTQELAYEFWHRMLFARFLAENHLLMHPDGVAVTLEECAELAPTADPPASNGFVLAARYASTMLPQIFRTDDVLLEIDFAPEQRLALEKLLTSLPRQTFLADDSLGWVYQFWQSKRKDEVNKTGDKIDGRTLPAVTQLFTEHYMVQFLLHNTIGAWWCGRHGIQGPSGGAGVPAGKSPVEMEYLRWRDDGTAAAGKFEGWPKTLAEFTMLDPCCGSGHFVVAAFSLLVPLRMHDEKLTAAKACDAVLRENLHGLELDPRCTQIAAFALALAAWKYPDAGGYRPLPSLNIACSGQCVTGKREEWLALANGDNRLCEGMGRLYDLFKQAPHLGSLIDPRTQAGDLFVAGFSALQSLLERAISNETDSEALSIGVSAQGVAKAANLLSRQFTLVATNVPYLGDRKQSSVIKEYCAAAHPATKSNMATCFAERCYGLASGNGTTALVTPQNWLLQDSYSAFRKDLLRTAQWDFVAKLGPGAFETLSGEVVDVVLVALTKTKPASSHVMFSLDVSKESNVNDKAIALHRHKPEFVNQSAQQKNPDCRVTLSERSSVALLETFAIAPQGIITGDMDKWVRLFWEVPDFGTRWKRFLSTADGSVPYSGREHVIDWSTSGNGMIRPRPGNLAVGKNGVAVNQMGKIVATLYCGELYDGNIAPLIPHQEKDRAALWAFCSSPQYEVEVRQIDKKVNLTNGSLLKVPFALSEWQSIADSDFPHGLPTPHSDDPTQWPFKGGITSSTDPLQVAVARLLDYRWPDQPKAPDTIDKLADSDGILCLPGVRGEVAAAERLLELLHAAYGKNWSDSVLHKLLTDAGCKAGTTLDDWLRNQFFEQHCKRFHNRPFVWHIWDGRKDGFSALVNYHKLDHKTLENLTYAYLGDWITAQGKSDKAGADSRLGDAQNLQEKLKAILTGDPPYDIFVRWKPLHEQAIGWHPDLNDGVRMNIRPFIEAGILRKNPNIKWTKDRGGEPERDKHDFPWFWSGQDFIGDRVNDVHLTTEKKTIARSRKKGAK